MVYFEHRPLMRSVLTGATAAIQCTGEKISLQEDRGTFLKAGTF